MTENFLNKPDKNTLMKPLVVYLITLLAFISLPSCSPDEEYTIPTVTEQQEQNGNNITPNQPENNKAPNNPSEDENNEENNNNEDIMENNKIKLTVNGRSFTATLEENSSAEALKALLMKGDLQIRMNDYGDMEKVGSLSTTLPRNDRQITTSPGDLILYLGNSFTIYYDVNTWNFTRLGRVDNVTTREEVLALLGGKGEITVTLSIRK